MPSKPEFSPIIEERRDGVNKDNASPTKSIIANKSGKTLRNIFHELNKAAFVLCLSVVKEIPK